MPDIGTGISGGLGLLGTFLGSDSEEGSKDTSSSSTSSGWGNTSQTGTQTGTTTSGGRREYEYMPTLNDDEKLALWSAAKNHINKSWLSGRQGTNEALASRGMMGGPTVKNFAASDRARNEALSDAATNVEIEGAKKLQKAVTDNQTGTTSSTSSATGSSSQGSSQQGTGNAILNSGSMSNQFGDLLSGLGGYGLGSTDFKKWLNNLNFGGGSSGGSSGSSGSTFGSTPSGYFSSLLNNMPSSLFS